MVLFTFLLYICAHTLSSDRLTKWSRLENIILFAVAIGYLYRRRPIHPHCQRTCTVAFSRTPVVCEKPENASTKFLMITREEVLLF